IERARINELQDLSRITPGLLVSNFSIGSPVIAIRGATNTFNQIGVDKPVGIVVDDVFIPRNSASTFQLFGLESIQVLRGPQGTLCG
ncbi:TonB-dependent receptor plug domain-containing protein, partial [Enterococcus faecalis]|uniref:TonB-dependent receptor plug domain-containing protein n=1 Tax=Enterococcus faecalis TaxID=1351 RepID=UPI00403F1CF9